MVVEYQSELSNVTVRKYSTPVCDGYLEKSEQAVRRLAVTSSGGWRVGGVCRDPGGQPNSHGRWYRLFVVAYHPRRAAGRRGHAVRDGAGDAVGFFPAQDP